MTENEQSIAHPSDQEMKESSGPTAHDQEGEADAAQQGTEHADSHANGNVADQQIPEVNQQISEEVGHDHVLEAPSDAADEMLQEAEIVLETEHPADEVDNEEPGTRSEQQQHGEYEEVATDDVEELPLEPEEMENMPETVDEQTYEEEQQLDEYVLGYEQDYVQEEPEYAQEEKEEPEYAQEEQDYGYDVEDADHGDFEPDFDQLAEHDEDNGNNGVDEVVHEKDVEDAEQGNQQSIDPATASAVDETQNDADAGHDRDDVPSTSTPDSSSKLEDSKKRRRPISWNDWKGVDEKPKPPEVKGPGSGKVEAAIVDKGKPKEPAEVNDSKAAKKRSRSRSPAKPNPSTQANGTKDGRSSSKGRSAEKDKERSKSADRSNPAKKQQSEAVRSDARRTSSPPRRSQLMGPGPVIKGRLVRGPPGAHPIMGPPARLIAVRRPIAAGPGMLLGRRQSPPPGFLPRGLVPVMPLRAAPLRAGLQPGEVLIPQLAPRRASFPPGRAPPGLEARFLGPPSIASDMATVRLAGPRDMQIVHVPREQLRTLRPVRDLREAEALRGPPPGMVKGPVGMRPGGPVLARPGRESVAVLREPPRDPGPSRGGPLMGPRDNFRMPVPPEMHGRLQGSVRQSPPRDERGQMRSASAPLHAPRGLDDPGRHRHGPTLIPSRRPPSPHRTGPPSRNSPPRMGPAPSASLRRPADVTTRPHSPPSKRSRHEPLPASTIPHRHPSNIPGPPGHPLSPRGSHPPNSSQRPSAALPSQRGPPNTNGRMMSSVQVAPPRMAGPPPQRTAPIHVGRDDRGRPGDERGRMQSGIPARARSPPRRDDRREMERREQERREQERRDQERREQERREQERREQERREQERQASMRRENERREQERREQERREQERREQERRSSSQRQASNSRSALPSSRDDSRRMHAHTQQPQPQRNAAPGRSTPGAGGRVGVVAGRGMGVGGSMAGGKGSGGGMTGGTMTAAGGNVSGWSQAPGMMAQQAPVVQQQVGQMMQQHLPGPPVQQSLPRPQVQPVAQQQMGVMPQGMGMQGMGMQAAAAANGNGLMVGGMNWNSAANPQPAAAASIPAPYAHLGSAVQQPLAPLNSAANTANNMQGSMGSMGRPRVDENENCWFYIDPQNQQQGPCSIIQFRKWLSYLETESKYEREYQQFKSVMVWKEGSTAQTPLWSLLQL